MPGAVRKSSAAIRPENSGMAPLIIPAREESIHCWATAKRVSGIAIQTAPRKAILGKSSRSTRRRAPGTTDRASAPNATRRKATSPGSRSSRPNAIRRKEEPHMPAIAARRPHSIGPNASVRVPRDVLIMDEGRTGPDAIRPCAFICSCEPWTT
jgi:hypothetical protein